MTLFRWDDVVEAVWKWKTTNRTESKETTQKWVQILMGWCPKHSGSIPPSSLGNDQHRRRTEQEFITLHLLLKCWKVRTNKLQNVFGLKRIDYGWCCSVHQFIFPLDFKAPQIWKSAGQQKLSHSRWISSKTTEDSIQFWLNGLVVLYFLFFDFAA